MATANNDTSPNALPIYEPDLCVSLTYTTIVCFCSFVKEANRLYYKRMRPVFSRIRGIGFLVWQARHMAYHVMLGLLWVWFLRERWGTLRISWIFLGAIGSIIPDIDHLVYYCTYGRKDKYVTHIFGYFYKKQWRNLFQFIAINHKHNTSLTYHNVYVAAVFVLGAVVASFLNWRIGVVVCGAIVSHFVFDMVEDVVELGRLNPNWTRWGRPRKK